MIWNVIEIPPSSWAPSLTLILAKVTSHPHLTPHPTQLAVSRHVATLIPDNTQAAGSSFIVFPSH